MKPSETYVLSYKVYDKNGNLIKEGKMKVKNCLSDLHSKIKLESFMKKKFANFNKLVVTDCQKGLPDIFGDFFGGGKNPFGGNPFKS